MYIDTSSLASLIRRDDDYKKDNDPRFSTSRIISIVCASISAFCFLLCAIYYYLKWLRKYHSEPKYLPGEYLKKKWRNWKPKHWYRADNSVHLEPMGQSGVRNFAPTTTVSTQNTTTTAGSAPTAGLQRSTSRGNMMNPHGIRSVESTPIGGSMNRQQSVRSIMTFRTLPEYSEDPKADERSWKAGEREGMDSVIELPDDAAVLEEQRREEEMEAQYQLRMARAAARASRDERRAARASGDAERIRAARESRDRSAEREELERLRLEHERVKKRPRAVSKVDYGNLGLVAGGKIRKTSQDSERPLLNDAGAMGEDEGDIGASGVPPPHYEDMNLAFGQPSPNYEERMPRERIGDSMESLDRMRTRSTPSPPPTSRDLTPPIMSASALPGSGLGLNFEDYGNPYNFPVSTTSHNSGSRTPSPPSASYFPTSTASAPVSRMPSVTQHNSSYIPQARPKPMARQSSIKRVQELMGRKSTHRMSLPPQPLASTLESASESASGTTPFPRMNEEMRTASDGNIGAIMTAGMGAGLSARNGGDPNDPRRMDTVQRRRRSINDLMGGAGRPASMEVTRQQFVLHTPPMSTPSPPLPANDSRRSSLVGFLPKLRSDSQVSLSSLRNEQPPMPAQPTIVVESATPIVAPGAAGKFRLGWEGGGSQRARGSGVSGR